MGNPPARGGTGILPAPISAAAGTPARAIERQRKEKQRQCDNRLDALRTIRHGTAVTRIAEESGVPEGQAKSEQAPIRRPPSRGGPLYRSASKAIFSLGPSTARSLFVKNKKRMGGGNAQPSSWLTFPVQWDGPHTGPGTPRLSGGGMSQLAPQLNPPGGRLPPLRHHGDARINIPDGSAVPTAACCSP